LSQPLQYGAFLFHVHRCRRPLPKALAKMRGESFAVNPKDGADGYTKEAKEEVGDEFGVHFFPV
jgi:hypothetical protein